MKKYFVRIADNKVIEFENYANSKNLNYLAMSYDYCDGVATVAYSITMDIYSALELKLSMPLIGCMTFKKISV
jgi:hypothetical protein